MKRLILSLYFMLTTLMSIACHESYITLVSGPTDIGGGQYSTTVNVCIGQTVNWGGTDNFTITLNGANFVSYLPANLSNTYNASTWASCKIAGATQSCQTLSCISVTANANSTSTANVITYSTSSSVPTGWPLVPNDIETCGANSISYCFNFTFVSDGYPTSVVVAGNVETQQGYVGCPCPFAAITQNAPCNGSYDPAMTLALGALPIELISFTVDKKNNFNLISWVTASEINNDFYTIETSNDANTWEVINIVDGAGNSTQTIEYKDMHYNVDIDLNYYRLTQVDFNGNSETFKILVVDNSIKRPIKLVKTVNSMGQEVNEYYSGFRVLIYDDGTIIKKFGK